MYTIGQQIKQANRTLVCGILNVTPDSFFDGGKNSDCSLAVQYAHGMISQGADIIDIGGESTRPGFVPISVEQEIDRVIPVVQQLRDCGVALSIDTQKPEVAEAALKNGVQIVNDIWGLRHGMAEVIAKYGASCVIVHNSTDTKYDDLIKDVLQGLQDSVDIALRAGIQHSQIVIDPGIGFGKTPEQCIEIIRQISQIHRLRHYTMLAVSNKSVFGQLGLDKYSRGEATVASSVYAALSGINIVRVHDVLANKRALSFVQALQGNTL